LITLSSARTLVSTVLLIAAVGVRAQQPPTFVQRVPVPDFSKVEIKTTRLTDDFYTLEAPGGADGVLLVDSQFPQLTDRLVAAIKRISNESIRFLINSHIHVDHTGGNANLDKLGVLIFGGDQLRAWSIPPPGPKAYQGYPYRRQPGRL
jgi:glyoxylase-like metal-dependent hydrolase (beta-lactamase superfamily II)